VLTIAPPTQIYLAAGPTDLRKAFDTLAAVVRNELVLDPLTGALFVFCNKRRNRVKILYWDRGGFWLLAKRLERGTFAWPRIAGPYLEMGAEQLTLLLGGIDVTEFRRRRWYKRAQ
jgi:transposase